MKNSVHVLMTRDCMFFLEIQNGNRLLILNLIVLNGMSVLMMTISFMKNLKGNHITFMNLLLNQRRLESCILVEILIQLYL